MSFRYTYTNSSIRTSFTNEMIGNNNWDWDHLLISILGLNELIKSYPTLSTGVLNSMRKFGPTTEPLSRQFQIVEIPVSKNHARGLTQYRPQTSPA